MRSTARKPSSDLKRGDVVDAGSGPTPRSLLHAFAEIARPEDLAEVHSFAPWWIAQCKPNCERVACEALLREGFEAWYPSRRIFSPVPQRMLPSKTRHKRRNEVRVSVEPIYPGYVFLRRVVGGFDVTRLWEIDGCSGLCVKAERDPDDGPDRHEPEIIPDYEIELMRVIEGKGNNDIYRDVSAFRAFTALPRFDRKAMRQWSSHGKIVGRLDESRQTSLFIARLDRIVRVSRIASAPLEP